MSSPASNSAMKDEATTALVPKLRFPEFRDSAGWHQKRIGPYLEDCSARVPPDTQLPIYSSTRDGLKRQDAYFDGRVLQNKNEYGVVPPGCLVYRHMSDDGLFKFNINQTGGEIAVSKEYPVFSTIHLNPFFLLATLNEGPDFKQFALSQKAGGTRTRLYFSRLCQWRTLLPSLPEQQKIADCLSSVDELIAAHARKLDALKTHKRGLMQQLFPCKGETVPRLRFPEFQNAGEWVKRTLGETARFYNGRAYKQEELLEFGKYPVLRVGNFFSNKNWYYSDLDLDETKYCDDGDLLYAWSASFGPRVWNGGKVIYHYHIWKVEERLDIYRQFLFITLENETKRMKAQSANGLGLLHITKGTIEGWESSFPPQPAEQQRIADCLTSLDDLIAAQALICKALNTHKNGLLQQLFPSMEEGEA
jgi:type I restriction enzyme, S subunit